MKTVTIKNIRPLQHGNSFEEQTTLIPIDQLNWPAYPYKPEVQFRIAHDGQNIYLKYYVHEKSIRAVATEINGDVYKDSCVEFFISPQGNGHYYNFEFSCIGTRHVAYGEGRHNRIKLPVSVIEKIEVRSSMGSEPFEGKQGDFRWELFAKIPIECFIHEQIDSLSGLNAKGNFYKCGDELAEPHFITWNPVGTENPDYHQSQYFGNLFFE